jgi:hypothetical protein
MCSRGICTTLSFDYYKWRIIAPRPVRMCMIEPLQYLQIAHCLRYILCNDKYADYANIDFREINIGDSGNYAT